MESKQELVTSLESNKHLDAGDVWIWTRTCGWEVLLESNCADDWIWNPTCGWELPLESSLKSKHRNEEEGGRFGIQSRTSNFVGIQQAS